MGYRSRHPYLSFFLISFFILFPMAMIGAQEVSPPETEAGASGVANEATAIALPVEESKNYSIQETETGVVFVQTLTWEATEYALRYEILLEVQGENGEWLEEGRYESDTNEVEVSILAGNYRYRVSVYNLLDLLEAESTWFEFEVYKAIQPTITTLAPSLVYLDEEQDGIFTFESNAIDEYTIFYIENKNTGSTILGELLENNDNNAKVYIDVESVPTGEYLFVAENRGGLKSEIDPLVVNFLKPYDLNLTASYNVAYQIPNDVTKFFHEDFFPFGANLKVTYIPFKQNFGHLGLELGLNWLLMSGGSETYDVSAHILPLTLSFVYQLPIVKKRFVMDLNAGIGTTFYTNVLFQFDNDITSEPANFLGITATAGLAFQVYLMNRLYLEFGVDYHGVYLPPGEESAVEGVTSVGEFAHVVVPGIGIGWQF